ncbi:neuroglobin-like [Microplitis mediator]|uniref:neuroglobin-like n=1 Tax=Microplitis mediator TaxID=375433 RepID=UPI002556F175|nr:neuroglobin-like [Microplitis mediator]XP_057341381.1 neuroglobin-like [Microplitis mediator]
MQQEIPTDTLTYSSTQRPINFDDTTCDIVEEEFTEDEIKRVQSTWDLLHSTPLETALAILERSMEIFPEFRQFIQEFYTISFEDIPEDIRCQKQALRVVKTVNTFVSGLNDIVKAKDFLFKLGKRHKTFGVKLNDFLAFRKSLLYVLDKKLSQLGYQYSEEDNNTWNKVLDTMLTHIVLGYNS